MLNEDFLKETLSKEDVSVDDKVTLIMGEYNADVRGLKDKNSELLGKLDKSKKKEEELVAGKTELESKYANLEDELKKNNPDDLKKLLEKQFADKENEYKAKVDALTVERDTLKANDMKRLLNEAIEDGCKDLTFMEGLKAGFIARVMSMYKFEAREIDGELKFLTSDMKEPKDVLKEFSLSNEGKAYIKNPSMGGGAQGSSSKSGSATSYSDNPWRKETFNLTKQAQIRRENPTLAKRLEMEAN